MHHVVFRGIGGAGQHCNLNQGGIKLLQLRSLTEGIKRLPSDVSHPANMRRKTNTALMLAHWLRRWPNINAALA